MATWKTIFLSSALISGSSNAHSSCVTVEEFVERTPVSKYDTRDRRNKKRRKEIAAAIQNVGKTSRDRAFLIMTARRESGLARFVDLDEDKCKSEGTEWCDWGKAYSVWQLHGMERSESREESADIAADRFRSSANYCRRQGYDYIEGGISLYATGESCLWKHAKSRAKEMNSIAGALCR